MKSTLHAQLAALLNTTSIRLEPLRGGMIGEVYRVFVPGGASVVAKVSNDPNPRLRVEGDMLRYLRDHSRLPVPEVLHSADTLLVMAYVEGNSFFDDAAERHAAELLADLHGVRADKFGFDRETVLAGISQKTAQTDSWIEYFRRHRLLYMAGEAARSGRLPAPMLPRIEALSAHLGRWLEEPEHPSLIHGDVWTTNVLAHNGRITAFLDPAIYYAHPEIELAFITLFNTFSAAFFETYHALRPIKPGFFETRRDLYNLYPLLTHVRLFGGGYVGAVDRILRRFGF